eukprot:g10367.t1
MERALAPPATPQSQTLPHQICETKRPKPDLAHETFKSITVAYGATKCFHSLLYNYRQRGLKEVSSTSGFARGVLLGILNHNRDNH